MKAKSRIIFLGLILGLFLAGCIKTGTKEIILPDQEIQGNQGYLQGSVPKPKSIKRVRKKKIFTIEVEVPSLSGAKEKVTKDEEIWGNQGYVYKSGERMRYIYLGPLKSKPQKKQAPLSKNAAKMRGKKPPIPSSKNRAVKTPAQSKPVKKYLEYKVEKGENLWTIAKKIYGDATKWTLIYENNRKILKKPGMLKPGMLLKIPISKKGQEEFIK